MGASRTIAARHRCSRARKRSTTNAAIAMKRGSSACSTRRPPWRIANGRPMSPPSLQSNARFMRSSRRPVFSKPRTRPLSICQSSYRCRASCRRHSRPLGHRKSLSLCARRHIVRGRLTYSQKPRRLRQNPQLRLQYPEDKPERLHRPGPLRRRSRKTGLPAIVEVL